MGFKLTYHLGKSVSMRDISYLERELLRVRRENEANANVVKELQARILELQEQISHLQELIMQQVNHD